MTVFLQGFDKVLQSLGEDCVTVVVEMQTVHGVFLENLLVVGRCISSTHEAQSSYRIMPFCAEIGQAAGTAIGLLSKDKKADVRDVDIKALQEILRKEGFVI